MDQERWRKIEELMQEALDLEAGEREAFLAGACGGDADLRAEVDRLLALGDEDFSLIERPAVEAAAALLAGVPSEERSGQRVGRYEIREPLGAGGMGEVYLARDTQLERNVALKLLPADYSADPERVRRFQQEARAASALNHPNIITIHEVGEHDGCQFIAIEYIEGETLRRRMARGRIGAGEAIEIAVQATGALAAAHRAGIIHRDVKPENIMLRPDGYVKVLDFGLAKLTEQAASAVDPALSTPGLVMGTARYMSPEQARAKELDARTDVFSLGVVLYEMVAGRRPFEGETASDVLAEILKVEPQPVTEIVEGAPEALDHVIGRALAKDRDERYGSAGELLADLKSLAKELDLQAEWTRLNTDSGGARALATSGARSAARTAEQSSTWHRVRDMSFTGLQAALGTTQRKAASAMLLFGLVFVPSAYVYQQSQARPPFERMTMTPLGVGDGFGFASISPDGAYLVEARESKSGVGVGLWSKNRATGSVVHLADTRHFLHQPVVTPDSKYVYYNDGEFDGPDDEDPSPIIIFRIPTLGGEPQEILREPWSNIGVSPDGARIAYARNHPDRSTTLCVANADGTGERVIASRGERDSFTRGGPAWSPDGTLVACGTTVGLALVPADGGEEQLFSTDVFRRVHRVAWPREGGGMIAAAGEREEGYQLWHLTWPELAPRRITSDQENYEALSATDDATTILSTQYGRMSNLWVTPGSDPTRAKQITSGKFHRFAVVRWTPDGRIIGPANTAGTRELWIMNADGSDRKPLTTGMNVRVPSVSPDGRYFLFTSVAPGNRFYIWRIDADGGNPTRLAEGHSQDCSPDGWVYFMGMGESFGLRKVRIEGGESERVTELNAGSASVSKDGKLLLCATFEKAEGPYTWSLLAADTGKLVRTIDAPGRPQWSPDGRGWFVGGPGGAPGIWVQPMDGGAPYKVAELPPNGASSWELSADGTLVYVISNDYADNVVIADVD